MLILQHRKESLSACSKCRLKLEIEFSHRALSLFLKRKLTKQLTLKTKEGVGALLLTFMGPEFHLDTQYLCQKKTVSN